MQGGIAVRCPIFGNLKVGVKVRVKDRVRDSLRIHLNGTSGTPNL